MVQLPVLTELRVEDYELFPGSPPGSGIAWPFQQGVTVIAGINGLGKTTLLLMILRSLAGRYDLTEDGAGQSLSVVLPKRPVRLKASHLRIFGRRVSDGAENAKVELSAKIGKNAITIRRRLDNLSLERLTIDEQPVELPGAADQRETIFQSKLTELIGLGSFVDVLLVLHHVVLFYENRPGALWDTNAQRHLLRALCLDQNDARRVVELERELQTADSQARNVHARITTTERRRNQAFHQEAGAEGVRAELAAEQKLLDAELQDAARLEQALQQLDDERKRVRLAYERAKIMREEADGAVEQLKYTALLKRFPSMDDTTRLALSRIMAEGQCMVCGSPAPERQQELEEQVARGHCPICGAEPEVQENVVSQHEFDKAKLMRERERAAQAKREEEAQSAALEGSATRYRETLSQWRRVQESMRSRREKNTQLRGHLPQTVTSRDYEHQLQILRSEHDEWAGVAGVAPRGTPSALRRQARGDNSRVEGTRASILGADQGTSRGRGPAGPRDGTPALSGVARSTRGTGRGASVCGRNDGGRAAGVDAAGRPERSLGVTARTHRSRVPASALDGVRRIDHVRDGDSGGKSGRYHDGARRQDPCWIRVQRRQPTRRHEQSDEREHSSRRCSRQRNLKRKSGPGTAAC